MQRLHTPPQAAQWLRGRVAGELRTDSRKLQPGDGFIAWPGAATDARQYVATALAQGAAACLVERSGVEPFGFASDAVAAFPELKLHAGAIADAYYAQPSQALDVVAVTGTNGKTSSTWWLAQALSNARRAGQADCGLIGTLGVGVPPPPDTGDDPLAALASTGLTTPDPVLLQLQLRRFADQGLHACAIEASSIGIVEHRLDGTRIRVAVFTNFTQDHLDYHGSMQAYWQAKAALFAWPGLGAAVVNVDDPQGAELAASLQGSALDLWTVSIDAPARLRATDLGHDTAGLYFTVAEGDARHVLRTALIGRYNVSNLLGVLATLRALGVPLADAVRACARLSPVPGRMDCVATPGQPLLVVDYAHTPDALDKALQALQPVARQRGGRLWCVFGCGGDRDASKRPLMGAVAERLADQVLVTSDNPRSENPAAIIGQIVAGLGRATAAQVQPDRALAIAQAVAQAHANDVVLIAGKGHEATQEIAGVKHPFSDKAQAQTALAQRLTSGASSAGGMLTLQQAQHWMAGAQRVGEGSTMLQRVHTDTRTLQPGDLFVALKGERFDANDFLAQAQARGAAAVLCHPRALPTLQQLGLPGLVVPDTLRALGALATGWRAQFSLPLIAVTGSNGKTTVTQMIASILRAAAPGHWLATEGNLNNDIGVPLTLLRLRTQHRLAVVELGMNHPGEIATLAAMTRPTVALVNNAQREHQEFMASVQAVAQENGAVLHALEPEGVAVFPADDAYTSLWSQGAGRRTQLRFALQQDDAHPADVFCQARHWDNDAWQVVAHTPQGLLRYRLRVAGQHNVKNSLAAVACALAAGVPLSAIAQGLNAFEPVKGRSRAVTVPRSGQPLTLIDDSYNANPDSVRAAIDVLADLPGPRLLVLGDMGEVGTQGPQFHAEVGEYARARGIEHVFTLGTLAAQSALSFGAGRHFDDIEALNAAVLQQLPPLRSVLVKGSRFMKMERVVAAITFPTPPQQETVHVA